MLFRNKALLLLTLVLTMILVLGACTSETSNSEQQSDDEVKDLVVYHRLTGYCDYAAETVNKVMLEEYNTNVICENLSSSEAYTRVLAERNDPQASVIIGSGSSIIGGIQNDIYADLDPDIVTNLDEINDLAKTLAPKLVAVNLNTIGIGYRTDIFEEEGFEPPTSWEDLYRPEFNGRVGMSSAGVSLPFNLLAAFTHIEGEDLDNLDPAFAKVEELVDTGQVTSFYDNAAMQSQAVLEDEVWIAPMYRFEALQLIEDGAPIEFVYPEEGFLIHSIDGGVIKGAPHQEEAQAFINLTLDKDFQTLIAESMDAPVREDLDLPDELREKVLPDIFLGEGFSTDWQKLSDMRDEIYNRWKRDIEAE